MEFEPVWLVTGAFLDMQLSMHVILVSCNGW